MTAAALALYVADRSLPPTVDEQGRAPSALLTAFQQFFALKLLCSWQLAWPSQGPAGTPLHVLAAVCTVAMCWGRTARLGVLGWLVLVLARVVRSWPYTLNHLLLELVVLVWLMLYPVRFDAGPRQPAPLLRVLWPTLLSVWFYSGLQKALQGYYLNGEYMALALLADSGTLGASLRFLAGELQGVSHSVTDWLSAGGPVPLSPLGVVERALCLGAGWLVTAVELLLPGLAFARRTRHLAVPALALAQLAVCGMSGEYDFALTGLGLIGLGWQRWARARYALLGAAAVTLVLLT